MIKDEDLRKWMGDRAPVQRTSAAHVQDHPDTGRVAVLEAEKAVLEIENRMLRERGEELKADRDDWKAQANRRWWDFLREWRLKDAR